MIQLKKKRISNTVNTNQTDTKHLSIQISLDGFSFCVLNKTQNKYTAIYDYEIENTTIKTPSNLLEAIESVFSKNELLKERYASVSVCHVNDLSTLVPKSLFQKEKRSTYIQYNNKVFSNDYIVHDEIKDHDIVNVFIPYVNINNFFIDKFGEFEYKHITTILTENLFNVYKYSIAPQMFVNVNKSHFELVVIKDRKLQLYNTFKYTTKEDFIYYILFTAEQLKLNPETFKLHLLGKVKENDELYSIAYKYVRNVLMLENRFKYNFLSTITEEDKKEYFTLLNIA